MIDFVIGYATIILYAVFLIFGVGSIVKKLFNTEISRKIIHIFLFVLRFLIDVFFKNTVHQILIPLFFVFINFLSYKFSIFKTIERTGDNHPGTVYFAIAVLMVYTCSYLFSEMYKFTYYGVMALTIGDGTAALFGQTIKSPKIYKKKSLIGFIACAIFTFLMFLINFFFLDGTLNIYAIIVLAVLTAIFELVDFGLDNFTITILIFLLAYLSFLLGDVFVLSLALGILVFLFVFFCKVITYYGSIVSMFIVFCFYFFGGLNAFIFLIVCYLVSVICSIIKKIKKTKINVTKKHGKRDAVQILVNGIVPTILIIIYYIVKIEPLLIISLIGIASNLVDSVSSDIGCLSTKKPYDLIKRKRVQTGLSGGVSILGITASLVVSILCSLMIFFFYNWEWYYIPIFAILIFVGTLIDSLLGSLIQKKNICPICGEVTEKEYHCDVKCNYYSGIKYIDNDGVNFLSSILNILISLVLLVVI